MKTPPPCELEIVEIFKQKIFGLKNFADIGSSSGYYTYVAATVMPEGSNIHTFEPWTPIFNELSAYVATWAGETWYENKNIVLHNCAMGRQDGPVDIFKNNTSSATVVEAMYGGNQHCIHSVQTTFDEYFVNREIDFVKLDVEGAELDILQGAKDILKSRDVRWLMEIHDEFLLKNKQSSEELYSLMKDFGYKDEFLMQDPKGAKLFYHYFYK